MLTAAMSAGKGSTVTNASPTPTANTVTATILSSAFVTRAGADSTAIKVGYTTQVTLSLLGR